MGVTGGIGSGKSVVCSRFEALGRTVLRADPIAQEIANTDPSVREQVAVVLGAAAYRGDGTMDRQMVADRVFADPSLLRKLNAIIHPPVIAEIERRATALPSADRRPYVLVEAALIYESGMEAMLDQVIVVEADEETRIHRVMERDGVERERVERRIAAQMPAGRKVERADFVLWNQENAVALDDKVRFLDAILVSMSPKA